jgi:AhpD family alkylhydroperoxidase
VRRRDREDRARDISEKRETVMTQRFDYARSAPEGMKALAGVHSYVENCGLGRELVELVYLRVSQINGCAYCIGLHSAALLAAGMAIEKLVLVPAWREAGALFSARENAALNYAEAVTRVSETHVPDDVVADARLAFSDAELSNLTIAIGLMNAYNRLAISARKAPDAAK